MCKSTMTNKSIKTEPEKDPAAKEVLLSPVQPHPGSAQPLRRSSLRQKVAFILPFVWPVGNRRLQCRVIIAFALLIAIRVVSVLVPIYSRTIVNVLTSNQETTPFNGGTTRPPAGGGVTATSAVASTPGGVAFSLRLVPFPWAEILIFIFLRSLRGGAGILNCLRSLIFVRVTQHAQKALRLRLFAHLHGLSLRWHLHRKTGEVIKVMDRGVNSVSQILSHVQANLVPVIIDIVIAIIYFAIASDVWIGLILLVTMASYLIITIAMSEWRKKFRRKMNEADNERNANGVDSILNFETVKYFSAESWETAMYAESIDEFQHREFLVNVTANLLGTVQNLVMSLGLLGGCLLSAWYVHKGHFRVGDYVLFLTYIHQLYEPLDLFGAYYRILQQAVVDMENMFDMLAEEEEVQDCAGATDLRLHHGQIEFDNVSFSYTPSKPLLNGLSFTVPPGQTYALVGLSGSGKTTVTRLLMRFYDIQAGKIKIDQQDIAKVTQSSLRKHIGVVPQDTGLFNREVRYNIRYGRVTATDTEVEEAACVADIHDRIVNLVEGYDSRIGERGLKLSGGERQRIAIARTVLKAPEIVLLDEATSALDTQTERHIQTSLARVCENRTTLIVAHRLSTVIHAHQILVLDGGTVRERGRHEELMATGGIYAHMWLQQQRRSSDTDSGMTSHVSPQSASLVSLQIPHATAPVQLQSSHSTTSIPRWTSQSTALLPLQASHSRASLPLQISQSMASVPLRTAQSTSSVPLHTSHSTTLESPQVPHPTSNIALQGTQTTAPIGMQVPHSISSVPLQALNATAVVPHQMPHSASSASQQTHHPTASVPLQTLYSTSLVSLPIPCPTTLIYLQTPHLTSSEPQQIPQPMAQIALQTPHSTTSTTLQTLNCAVMVQPQIPHPIAPVQLQTPHSPTLMQIPTSHSTALVSLQTPNFTAPTILQTPHLPTPVSLQTSISLSAPILSSQPQHYPTSAPPPLTPTYTPVPSSPPTPQTAQVSSSSKSRQVISTNLTHNAQPPRTLVSQPPGEGARSPKHSEPTLASQATSTATACCMQIPPIQIEKLPPATLEPTQSPKSQLLKIETQPSHILAAMTKNQPQLSSAPGGIMPPIIQTPVHSQQSQPAHSPPSPALEPISAPTLSASIESVGIPASSPLDRDTPRGGGVGVGGITASPGADFLQLPPHGQNVAITMETHSQHNKRNLRHNSDDLATDEAAQQKRTLNAHHNHIV